MCLSKPCYEGVGDCRYEELRVQLRTAQDAAEQEQEEEELARATAAVNRLTAPSQRSNGARAPKEPLQQVHWSLCMLLLQRFGSLLYLSVPAALFGCQYCKPRLRSSALQVGDGPAARAVKSLEEQVRRPGISVHCGMKNVCLHCVLCADQCVSSSSCMLCK